MAEQFVFFLPDIKGGVETLINNYVRVLSGNSIKVVKYKSAPSFFSKTSRAEEGNVEQNHISFNKHASRKSRFIYLRKLIQEKDVLVCSDSFELEFINYFQLANKVIFLLHGDLEHYNRILKKYQNIIDAVFCVSTGLKNKYSQLYPSLAFKVSHPIVLNTSDNHHGANNPLKCIYIARFEYQKGADLLLDLINACKEIDWTIITTDFGTDAALLEKIPVAVKVYKDLGNEKVLEILKNMDVLIFPSRSEGFGIAVLESLFSGVVPIVLDIPIGIPDQVIDGYNGFIVKPENWQDAAGHLRKLNNNNEVLTEMKKNAKNFAKKNFDPISIAAEFAKGINDTVIRKEKKFNEHAYPFFEKNMPEPIYRALKILRSKMTALKFI